MSFPQHQCDSKPHHSADQNPYDDLIGRLKKPPSTPTERWLVWREIMIKRGNRTKIGHDRLYDDGMMTSDDWLAAEDKFDSESNAVRPSWEDYFFDIAAKVKDRSTCDRGPIGVVIVDECHRILGTGYPGAPAGEDHCLDVGHLMPYAEAEHCVRTTHAEINAVEGIRETLSTAVSTELCRAYFGEGFLGRFNATAYVLSLIPCCSNCTKHMYTAGIKDVRWRKS